MLLWASPRGENAWLKSKSDTMHCTSQAGQFMNPV